MDTGEYVREYVTFQTTPDLRVPAYVLIPRTGKLPAPAVVLLHCHGGFYVWGKEKVVELEDEHPALTRFKQQLYARPAMKQPPAFNTGDPSYFVAASTCGSVSPAVLTGSNGSADVRFGFIRRRVLCCGPGRMKKWFAGVSIVLAASSLFARSRNELVLAQPPFAVYSGFWQNLHYLLWAEAWARRPPSADYAAGRLPEPLRAELTADERRAWDEAVALYDAELADLHPLFEMRSIRKALVAAGAELPEAGLDPEHRDVLIAAAPVYRKYWWPAHDAANRAWIQDMMSKAGALSPSVPDRLARLYGTPWFTSGIRVDVVRVGNREGAITSIDPPPAHITMSSSAPALEGWGSAEVLFHETSHVLVFPLIEDVAAELRTQGKSSPQLWHVALFYLTGEVVRQALAERGIAYQPYLYRTGLFDRAWPELKAPIETYWKPYVDGAVPREKAIKDVVRAIESTDVPAGMHLMAIVTRTRAAEVAAILLIAIWAAFASRPVLNPRTLIVVAIVTVFLAVTVRMVTIPAGNVAVHALASGSSLLAASALVRAVARRGKIVRAAAALVAALGAYVAGRELAILLVSTFVRLAS